MNKHLLGYGLFATLLMAGCKNSTEPDTTAPNVEITTPQSGSQVSGTSTIRVNATDDVGI